MNRPPAASPPFPFKTRVLGPLERFFHIEASSGIVLLGAAIAALLWANSPWGFLYDRLWHLPLTLGVGEFLFTRSLHFWINDGLMTIFFLLVGLEIRRELHEGALVDFRQAILPLAAALGGVITPALIYLALNADPVMQQGWAIPTATDIAFAIGVLTLLGRRVPPALRVLLLAIAIIDDIVAILVIAFFYSDGIASTGLFIAAAGILGVLMFQRMGVRHALAYVAPGVVVWAGLLSAGVHPALAGVILGLLTPAIPFGSREGLLAKAARAIEDFRERTQQGEQDLHKLSRPVQELKVAQREILPPVVRVQLSLHPWVAYGIMPLFALANAGVNFDGLLLNPGTAGPLAAGIIAGLVLGKPLGIALVTALFVKLGWCSLPTGTGMKGIWVIGCLGGIGFTMSIFICDLAFSDPALLATAKLVVLIASTIAALAGLLLGYRILRVPALQPDSNSS